MFMQPVPNTGKQLHLYDDLSWRKLKLNCNIYYQIRLPIKFSPITSNPHPPKIKV